MQFILPTSCLICSYQTAHPRGICDACHQALPILPQSCLCCAQVLWTATSLCGTCLTHPKPFDRTYALFPYQPPIIRFITLLKFNHELSHAHTLGQLLIEKIKSHWYRNQPLPELIIPIPLHPKRLQERGFNQALEIAKPIGKFFNISIDYHGTKRIKETVAQSGLKAPHRKRNMAHAFATQRSYAGLHVAILDDVITTGMTVSACAAVLKQSGAKRIDVWCVARRE